MKTLNHILPLGNRILVTRGGKPAIKRVYRQPGSETITSTTDQIHGLSAVKLKRDGYTFLREDAWPWNADGKIDGPNPSMPSKFFAWHKANGTTGR
jgi:hypothetical protein